MDSQKIINQKVKILQDKMIMAHQQALLPSKTGIVLIGNSRIGKSTLAAMLSGMQMRLFQHEESVVIEPMFEQDRKKTNLFSHSSNSVTTYPNILQTKIDNRIITIVDLPGFQDNQPENQIANGSYIQSVLSQLDEVLFVMVLKTKKTKIMAKKENKNEKPTFSINIKEDCIQMMQRFAKMFPAKKDEKHKENLITIVNFSQKIESQIQENKLKKEIKENLMNKLKEPQYSEISTFYSKSFDNDRLLLIQKAKRKQEYNQVQLKKGIPIKIQSLNKFIELNINLSKDTQQSSHKINLLNYHQKGIQMQKVLIQYVKTTFEEISNYMNRIKTQFKLILEEDIDPSNQAKQKILSQIDGLVNDQNLSKYSQIILPEKNLKGIDLQKKKLCFEDIILEIAIFFHQISSNRECQNFRQGLLKLNQQCLKLIDLVQTLSRKKLHKQIPNIIKINENLKKKIHCCSNDILYFLSNIQDFKDPHDNDNPNPNNLEHKKLMDTCQEQRVEFVFQKISIFKAALTKYLEQFLKKKEKKTNKQINAQQLMRLKKAFGCLSLTDQIKKTTVITYKSLISKLLNKEETHKNPQELKECLKRINEIQKDSTLLKHIQDYKKSEEFKQITGKCYISLLKFLSINQYKHKKKLVSLYFKIDFEFKGLITVLQEFIKELQDQEADMSEAKNLCHQAVEHMIKNHHYLEALDCLDLLENIYMYSDNQKIIELKKKRCEIYGSFKNIQVEFKNIPAWRQITKQDYEEILKIVQIHLDQQEGSILGMGSNLQHIQSSLSVSDRFSSPSPRRTSKWNESPQLFFKSSKRITLTEISLNQGGMQEEQQKKQDQMESSIYSKKSTKKKIPQFVSFKFLK